MPRRDGTESEPSATAILSGGRGARQGQAHVGTGSPPIAAISQEMSTPLTELSSGPVNREVVENIRPSATPQAQPMHARKLTPAEYQ